MCESQGFYVNFKYQFYRYNMNDREIRSKKTSVVNIKTTNNDKSIVGSHIKLGPHCEPKQPPNISRHYFQETKKKQSQSREILRHQAQIYCIQPDKAKSKIMLPVRPRPSQSKNQDEHKVKKTKRQPQPHYISVVHKSKGNKISSKENRESKSNMDIEDNRRQKQKMAKTQVFFQERPITNLTCKERIIKNIKKNLKGSEDHKHCRISSQQIIPKKSFAEEMAQFESMNQSIQIQAESETLAQLFYKEMTYSRIENYNCYLVKKQPDMTWWKRAKVMNWMIQILSELGSLREVFALASNYVDRYLAVGPEIRQQKLQVLACAAMSLANKMEGETFKVRSFQIPTCDNNEIMELEHKICQTLKWRLNPPTLNMWANRIAQHWDLYLDHHVQNLPNLILTNMDHIKFKDSQSYYNFRALMQYIDLVMLDIETLQYHNREIAASFIFIMLSQKLKLFTMQEIFRKWPKTSQYLFHENELNDFYCQFLQESFGFSLQDLLPTIQYCSTFINLELTYELPSPIDENDDNSVPFSSLCSMITCNPKNLTYLQTRARDLR